MASASLCDTLAIENRLDHIAAEGYKPVALEGYEWKFKRYDVGYNKYRIELFEKDPVEDSLAFYAGAKWINVLNLKCNRRLYVAIHATKYDAVGIFTRTEMLIPAYVRRS